jgi:multidrug efflux system membrane fusion protein
MKKKVVIPTVLLAAVIAAAGFYVMHVRSLEQVDASAVPAPPPPVPVVAGTVAQHGRRRP